MERPKVVFKIDVSGVSPITVNMMKKGVYIDHIGIEERYPVQFRVVLYNHEYHVVCIAIGEHISCGKFGTEFDAIGYLRVAMKMAMHGDLLYKTCLNCQKSLVFPSNFCNDCGMSAPLEFEWQVQKMKI